MTDTETILGLFATHGPISPSRLSRVVEHTWSTEQIAAVIRRYLPEGHLRQAGFELTPSNRRIKRYDRTAKVYVEREGVKNLAKQEAKRLNTEQRTARQIKQAEVMRAAKARQAHRRESSTMPKDKQRQPIVREQIDAKTTRITFGAGWITAHDGYRPNNTRGGDTGIAAL